MRSTLFLSVCLALAGMASAGPAQRATVGDGGLGDLMGMIDAEQPAQSLCQKSSLSDELARQTQALTDASSLGCKAIASRLGRLDATARQAAECQDPMLQQQAQNLSNRYRQLDSTRCSGNSLDGIGQAIALSGMGLDIMKRRDQEKAEERKRRQKAARYLDRSVNPDNLVFSASALQNWRDITTSTIDGSPVLQICIRDHECEDGDILNVWVNSRMVIADELLNTASCTLEKVAAGANRIQVFAPNGTGYKGKCNFADANTGEISVSGVDSSMSPINTQRQQWQLQSKAGSSTSIRVFVK